MRPVPAIPLKRTKLTPLDLRGAVRQLADRTGRDLRLMHIQANHPLMQGRQFRTPSFPFGSVYNQTRKVAGARTENA
jgi:hypothetical protein